MSLKSAAFFVMITLWHNFYNRRSRLWLLTSCRVNGIMAGNSSQLDRMKNYMFQLARHVIFVKVKMSDLPVL